MPAPLDNVDAIETGVETRERHVEYRDAPAGVAQGTPEWLAANELTGRQVSKLVGSRHDLHEVMHAVVRWVGAGVERRPGRADVESLDPSRATHDTSAGERAKVRQRAIGDPAVEQIGARGVDPENEKPGRRRHRLLVSIVRRRWRVKVMWRHPPGSARDARCHRHAEPRA